VISKKEKSLVAAQKLIERGQLDKAIAEFAKVVADDPKDTRTLLKMAELHAKLGTNAEAAAIYVRTGELYIEQGLSQKAVAVYKNALKLAPGMAKTHLALGALYKQIGLGSDAVQQFELGATAFTKDGAPGEAAAALRQAVALDPDNPVLRVKLAEAASLGGLIEEAVREFGRAAEQLKGLGRLDESLRVLERLLFHQPDNTTKAREVAEAYITRGSPRLALPKLQACLNADPRETRTLFLLARALEQLGQKEKAVSVLKELARLYQDLGRWNEREAALARALAMAPSDPELRAMVEGTPTSVEVTPRPTRNLDAPPVAVDSGASGGVSGTGRVAVPLGVGETSARLVAADADSEAGSVVARLLAEGEVFIKYGMLDRAADHLARVFAVEPQNLEAREKLITVLQQLDRPADAARELEILAQHLARTDPSAAERALAKARFLDPQGARARAARPMLPTMALDAPDSDPRASQATPAPAWSGGLSIPIATDFDQNIATGDVVLVQDSDSHGRLSLEAPAFGVTPRPETAREVDLTPPPTVARRAPRGLDVATPPPVLTNANPGLDLSTTPPPLMRGGAPHRLDVTPPPVETGARDLGVVTPPPVRAGATRGLDLSTTPPPERIRPAYQEHVAATPPPLASRAPGLTTPPPFAPPHELDVVTPPPEIRGALPGLDLATPPPSLHSAAIDRDFEGIALPGAGAPEVDWPRGLERYPGLPLPGEGLVTTSDDDELNEDLDQVTFFLDQGMPDDARWLLQDLATRFPGDVRVTTKLRDLDAGVKRAAPMEISGAQPVAAFPLDERQSTPAPRAMVEGGSVNDASTRIDLAIAYKEMGLFDAAIAELRSLVDTPNEVLALTMMGECFEAKGSFTEAVIRYKGALNCTPIRPDEMMQLYFLLGAAFERLGDPSEALYFFEKVARRDPRFRDVDRRILALKPKLAKAAP